MSNDFLRDLPDLHLPAKRKKKKKPAPVPVNNVVIYVRLRCPKCRSDKVPVQHTNPEIEGNKVRHHKCENCGHTFKSVEQEA